mgnify:CR=1 FL=1
MFKFDLHVHTVLGSSDSGLSPRELIGEAERIGLDGVCLTEHGGGWDESKVEKEFGLSNLVVVTALEVTTDMGHVIAVGLNSYSPGIHRIEVLRQVIDDVGGVLISAHPLRNFFNAPPYNANLLYQNWPSPPGTPRQASRHELFTFVDFIEVTNGANSDRENRFTLEIADQLSIPGTGGSDSHSVQGIGKSLTIFDDEVKDQSSLIKALKSGKFYPAEGLNTGTLKRFAKKK